MRTFDSRGRRLAGAGVIVGVLGLLTACTVGVPSAGQSRSESRSATAPVTPSAGPGSSPSAAPSVANEIAYYCGQFDLLVSSVNSMNALVTTGVIVETDVDVMLPFVGSTFTSLSGIRGDDSSLAAIRAAGKFGAGAKTWSAFQGTTWQGLAAVASDACVESGGVPRP